MAGETWTETAVKATLGFRLDLNLFTLPVDAERRIGNNVVKFITAESIIGEGVAVLHAGCVASLDEHISLGDSVGFRVELLSKTGKACVLADCLRALGQTAEHLGSAHGIS